MIQARALFLDRDGTLMYDRGYLRDPEGVELLPGVCEALRTFQADDWKLFILSNQSGVGRGVMTMEEMHAVHDRFLHLMREAGIRFEACYLCTHNPDEACQCRKPSAHFIELAVRDHDIAAAGSWMIGDRETDIVCGKTAGCRTIWIETPGFTMTPGLPDFIASDWNQVRAIIERGSPRWNSPGR